jgi:hypothetical protein
MSGSEPARAWSQELKKGGQWMSTKPWEKLENNWCMRWISVNNYWLYVQSRYSCPSTNLMSSDYLDKQTFQVHFEDREMWVKDVFSYGLMCACFVSIQKAFHANSIGISVDCMFNWLRNVVQNIFRTCSESHQNMLRISSVYALNRQRKIYLHSQFGADLWPETLILIYLYPLYSRLLLRSSWTFP